MLVRYISLLLLSGLSFSIKAETITIAVASNFTAAMKDVVTEFELQSGHNVIMSFGSSGKFYAQIKNGAPFQAFFSADQAKPAALENAGVVVPESRFTYATGTLALWSNKSDIVGNHITVLKQSKFNKLAMANPKLAPYGAAAIEVLKNLKLIEQTQHKWIKGENIAQTYQFVATKNADLGFVALSQIMRKGKYKKGSAWIVPEALFNPIKQDAVLLRKGQDSPAVYEFMQFIRSDKAKEIIKSYGYKTHFDKNQPA